MSSLEIQPISKIWIVEEIRPLLNQYKGDKALTKNGKALIELVNLGFSLNPTGRYADKLIASGYSIKTMKAMPVKVDEELDRRVKSFCGKLDISLYQGTFALVCEGLMAHGAQKGWSIDTLLKRV